MKPANPSRPVAAHLSRRLLAAARKAAARSYSPYSKFAVGAALVTADNRIITGCNVENSSYGLTLCAERNALVTAVAARHRRFKALAVVGGRTQPACPCGACLQVLAEFCPPEFPIFLAALGNPLKTRATTLGALLPQAFHL